ncbi:hypothetical protein lam_349 [Candidatus Liberibacter americanus str. Sao Paulo]|uniref:Uncharacterized protein n=1 Tax=Candidatus Liberibacter americanus str. Sao Paulo TaxID=1261131 RepID=U6B3U9_9HYPH|nr:hypothetical protein lam_349 [Candidatus Liberibacter americanus str. Sao Paulo]
MQIKNKVKYIKLTSIVASVLKISHITQQSLTKKLQHGYICNIFFAYPINTQD